MKLKLFRMRSLLFVPATHPRRFEKAIRSGADAVCVDLEDAVALSEKEVARRHIVSFFSTAKEVDVQRVIRINSASNDEITSDILLLRSATWRPDFLMLPKIESAGQIDAIYQALGSDWANVPALATLETAAGLESAVSIASHEAVIAVAFGSADYSANTGCDMSWDALVFGRGRIVQAAAIAGVAPLDGAWIDTKDRVGLSTETQRLPSLGFVGRVAIHPNQIAEINDAFTPNETQIAQALAIVAADDAARGGVTVLDGRMIDAPIVERARRTAAFARP